MKNKTMNSIESAFNTILFLCAKQHEKMSNLRIKKGTSER
jgi:hypothetical protein